MKRFTQGILCAIAVIILAGCSSKGDFPAAPAKADIKGAPDYLIGPGDALNIQVWRNPEVSTTVTVRPDGRINSPLVDDMIAANKTPTQLERDMEKHLAKFIQDPIVTVMVTGFSGPYSQQIRVIGQAARPQALQFKENMSLMDVMILVGGITDFAAGNKATIMRNYGGKQNQFSVRLEDLIRGGDISANVEMMPGDVLIIPESFF